MGKSSGDQELLMRSVADSSKAHTSPKTFIPEAELCFPGCLKQIIRPFSYYCHNQHPGHSEDHILSQLVGFLFIVLAFECASHFPVPSDAE